jgi:hypothetical protein
MEKEMVTLPDGRTFEWVNLRTSRYEGVDIIGWKTATSGTLRGQTLKHFITNFNTEEEAFAYLREIGVTGEVHYSNKWTEPQVNLNHLRDEE